MPFDQNGVMYQAPMPPTFSQPNNLRPPQNVMPQNFGQQPGQNFAYSQPTAPQPLYQQRPPQSFVGRTVRSPDDIKPSEVPMDGSIAIFPAEDLGSIYIKGWNSNGVMITLKYVVDPTWNAPPPQPETQNTDILKRLDALEKAIASSRNTRKNKEVES